MPESLPPDDTEQLLSGADGPRPLPPDLRRRLTEQLLTAAPSAPGARPLPRPLRSRLEQALPSGADRRWRWVRPASAAAAVLLVAAVAGIALHGGTPNRPVTTATAGPARNATEQRSGAAGSTASQASGAGGGVTGSSAATGGAAAGAGSSAAGSGGAAGGPAGGPLAPSPAAPASAAPAVSGLSPASGPSGGGTWVTITGRNLTGATAVRFGTTPTSQLMVVSATQVRALSPAHRVGPVDVTVVTPSGTSPVGPEDRYTYVA